MIRQVPNVVRLQIHLPGQHLVVFNPDEDPQALLERAASERTTLTEFFAMNQQNGHIGELARSLTYQEFPQHMTWDTAKKKWSARKDGFALGHMYFVSPTEGERFYLRTLLTVVKGPQSYDDLLTFNGHHHNSFREACIA